MEIFKALDKKQNISISYNKENNKIYLITNPHKYESLLKIYYYDNGEYMLEKTIVIKHPFYEISFGDYDEKKHKILLGIVGKNFTEANFFRRYYYWYKKIRNIKSEN